MPDGCNRMIPHHARTCVAHDFTHLFLHVRLITMDRTLLASRFVFTEFAMIQTLIGIVEKDRAIFAKPFAYMLFSMAVNLNHLPYGFLFLLCACHLGILEL